MRQRRHQLGNVAESKSRDQFLESRVKEEEEEEEEQKKNKTKTKTNKQKKNSKKKRKDIWVVAETIQKCCWCRH